VLIGRNGLLNSAGLTHEEADETRKNDEIRTDGPYYNDILELLLKFQTNINSVPAKIKK
jgi:hypothetical protein